MAILDMTALCAGICTLAKLAPPNSLVADRCGLLAFHMTLHDKVLSVLNRPAVDPDTAWLIVEMGDLPPENELPLLRGLLDGNFAPTVRHAWTLARNPGTGQALLQLTVPLECVTPERVYASMEHGVRIARLWQALAQEGPGGAATSQGYAEFAYA